MTVPTTIDRIRAYATATGLRPSTLAKLAGLHPNALRDMHGADWDPRSSTLSKVEAAIARHQELNSPDEQRGAA